VPLLVHRSLRFLIAGLMAVSLLGVAVFRPLDSSAQASVPASAEYVPAHSLLFLTVDLDVTSTPWLQAAILAQRIDQRLTPEQLFGSLAGSVFGEQAAQIDPQLFLGGEVTLVLVELDVAGIVDDSTPIDDVEGGVGMVDVSVAAAEVTQGLVLIALPPDVSAADEALQAALSAQAETDGVTVESSSYAGIDIQSIPANAESGRPGMAIAQVDDALVAAATPAELEPVIDVRVNDASSMADNEAVPVVLEPLASDYLAIGVLNGPAAAAAGADAGTVGGITEVVVPGGDNAVTGFTLTAVNEGFRVDTRSASTNGEPVAGMNAPYDAELIGRMPADTQVLIDGYNLGGTGVIDAAVVVLFEAFFGSLEAAFVPFQPQGTPVPATVVPLDEAAQEAYSTVALLLGVNLQTELVQLLDGEYALGIWGIDNGDIAGAGAALIARTSDPATVDATLASLTNFLGVGASSLTGAAGATPGSAGAAELTVIDLSTDGTDLAPISFGVVGDEIIIGYGEGGEVAVNGVDDPLSESELFGAVTAELPQERNFLLYVNLDALQSTLQSTEGGLAMVTSGQAFGLAGFQDGDLAGTQGLLYIPEE
jgi:hypothetical protein